MNLILLKKDDLISDNRIRLDGRRAKHLRSVHRAELGKQLTIGMINGLIGTGIVVGLTNDSVVLDIELNKEPPTPIPVTLVLALPRPKSLKKALHAAMSMGVKNIHIINSFRVDKSYWQTPILKEEGLFEQIALALEQCKDTVVPTIELHKRFKPFVEDYFPSLSKDTHAIVAHPTAEMPCPFNIQKPVTLVIGPEGGFIPYEVELLQNHGAQAVSIGKHILRVEFAIPAILGKLF